MKTDRVWTIAGLDHTHPLEDENDEGWTWKLDEDGRPFAVNGDRARIYVDDLNRLRCDDIDGDNADVALAVILASKGLDSLETLATESYRLGQSHERTDVVDFITSPPGRIPEWVRGQIAELAKALRSAGHVGWGKRLYEKPAPGIDVVLRRGTVGRSAESSALRPVE
jgi:hypothetical protein